MKTAVLITRSLLGLLFLAFGINFFYPFLHLPMPVLSAKASAFEGGLFGSGYFFQYMKVLEILSGLFLLINRFTVLFLLILFPISLNIFLFHIFLAPAGTPVGVVVLLLNLFLGFAYRKYYAGLFTAKPNV